MSNSANQTVLPQGDGSQFPTRHEFWRRASYPGFTDPTTLKAETPVMTVDQIDRILLAMDKAQQSKDTETTAETMADLKEHVESSYRVLDGEESGQRTIIASGVAGLSDEIRKTLEDAGRDEGFRRSYTPADLNVLATRIYSLVTQQAKDSVSVDCETLAWLVRCADGGYSQTQNARLAELREQIASREAALNGC